MAVGRRFFSQACQILYKKHGIPSQILEKQYFPINSKFERDDTLITRTLAAPINPSDINMIEGVYAVLPQMPAIAGNEGILEVVDVANEKSAAAAGVRPGDLVIPARPGLGTWCTYKMRTLDEIIPVPFLRNIPPEQAAVITVNPPTAWRMLHDFVQLMPGDTIIQNGANSGVGMAVIQFAHQMGVNTINMVRSRPDSEALKQQLTKLGATIVLTEEELAKTECRNSLKTQFPRGAQLALNCVSGSSTIELCRYMADGATLVTYGGMSKKPLVLPTSKFIFNDIKTRGFWLTRWINEHSREERLAMLKLIANLIEKKKFISHITCRPFEDFDDALSEAVSGKKTSKVVLTM